MRDNLQKIVAKSVAQVLKVELEFIEDKSRDLIEEWDSLAHMEIVLRIEETLGISLPEESILILSVVFVPNIKLPVAYF